MKKLIVLLIVVSVTVLSGCDDIQKAKDMIGMTDTSTEESYVSSNGIITVSIKYSGYDDLDAKYAQYGDLIDAFVDDVEFRILEDLKAKDE